MTRILPRRLARGPARGFSLIAAIFLLIVLSALGAAMLSISGSSQNTAAQDIQGERAYQAARAGLDWGLSQQLRSNPPRCTTTSFVLPAGNTLSSFTVTVECVTTPLIGQPISTAMNGALTGGAANVILTNPDTTAGLAVGMIVRGAGIVPDTAILAIDDMTSLTLTHPVAASATGVTQIYYLSPFDSHTITSTACNQPSATGCSKATSNNPDYVQSVVTVEF